MSIILSFGLFADTHYAKDLAYGNRICKDGLLKMQDCVAAFNERSLPFAVNLGDQIDHRGEDSFNRKVFEDVVARFGLFKGERHSVVGNHDVSCLPKSAILEQFEQSQTSYYSFNHSGFHFVVLDTNYHEDGADFDPDNMPEYWGDAWVSQKQLDWLADDLAAANEMKTVVFCHADIDYHEYNDDRDPHVICNHAEVQSVLEQAGNVIGVIQGHYHGGRQGIVNGIPYFSIPGMCEGPYPDNNAYAIAHLHDDFSLSVETIGCSMKAYTAMQP